MIVGLVFVSATAIIGLKLLLRASRHCGSADFFACFFVINRVENPR